MKWRRREERERERRERPRESRGRGRERGGEGEQERGSTADLADRAEWREREASEGVGKASLL